MSCFILTPDFCKFKQIMLYTFILITSAYYAVEYTVARLAFIYKSKWCVCLCYTKLMILKTL